MGEQDERGKEGTRDTTSETPVVGTAVGSSEAGAGVGGGDVGQASGSGDAVGRTAETRASVPGSPEAEETSSVDAAEFARATAKRGSEAGLAGGQGDLGAGGDLAGDFGGLDDEGDEGRPA